MNTGRVCAAFVALGLIAPALGHWSGTRTYAASYNVQEDPAPDAAADSVALGGLVTQVDADRDRVTFAADDGRSYTLDTSRTEIALPGTDRLGDTTDLAKGMRLRVDGSRVSGDIIQADRIRVVGTGDAPPAARPGYRPAEGDNIDLRGTVQSVNQRRGSFVVHINDHTRTIYVTDSTDLSGLDNGSDTSDRVPLRQGTRVIVTGTLRPDGTVMADTVRPASAANSDRGQFGVARELVGRVTRTSNRLTSRDIKIQDSPDHETTVHVPAGTPVFRDGQAISVHDLTEDDIVRVSGAVDGNDLRADRITVIQATANHD